MLRGRCAVWIEEPRTSATSTGETAAFEPEPLGQEGKDEVQGARAEQEVKGKAALAAWIADSAEEASEQQQNGDDQELHSDTMEFVPAAAILQPRCRAAGDSSWRCGC